MLDTNDQFARTKMTSSLFSAGPFGSPGSLPACFGLILAALLLPQSGYAASKRILWDQNGHYYQSFDGEELTWIEAGKKCEARGAHLVTLTSEREEEFVRTSFFNRIAAPANVWIGASDTHRENRYEWVSGERWLYSNWDTATITFHPRNDYVFFRRNDGSDGKWRNGNATDLGEYVCEWSANNYVDVTDVDDLNGNGSKEIAALYIDGLSKQTKVLIRDPGTDETISLLNFGRLGSKGPLGVVSINDLNGNGVPEIAILYQGTTDPEIELKDAKNEGDIEYNKGSFFWDGKYLAKSISVSPDRNGNGSSEITVIGIHKITRRAKAETQDSAVDNGHVTRFADTEF